MTRRGRLTGTLALWGFLACVSWSTGLIPTRCCSAAGASGSGSCDSTAAKSSTKSDIALEPAASAAQRLGLDARILAVPNRSEFLPSLSPAFRRPMRN